MQSSLGPESPNNSIKRPRGVQMSHQKLIFCPFPRFAFRKFEAIRRRFSRDLHVQDPAFLASKLQKLSSPIFYFLIQEAHSDGFGVYNIQISFRQRVLFHVSKSLSPSPPSFFGKHTVLNAIFATPLRVIFPVHRKREQRLWICLMHPFGRTNADVQKFMLP